GYDVLTQGAGFLNALGAVRLARFYATAQAGDTVPVQAMWSKHIVWGNHMLSGGIPLPDANAWHSGVVWGAAQSETGDNIVWGSAALDNIVWGSSGLDLDNIVWSSSAEDNIVWGSSALDNIVWGSSAATDTTWTAEVAATAAATSTGPTLDQMSDEQLLQLLIQMTTSTPSAATVIAP